MKIVDYKILNGMSSESLSAFVFQAIKEGWQPLGGVAINHNQLSQAVVKYEKPRMSIHASVTQND